MVEFTGNSALAPHTTLGMLSFVMELLTCFRSLTQRGIATSCSIRWLGRTGCLWLCASLSGISRAQELKQGLEVTFANRDQPSWTETAIWPQLAIYVPAGEVPAPFIRPGAFGATWSGFLTVELRGEYRFQAELNGALKLRINDAVVLDVAKQGELSGLSAAVKLKKGTNSIYAELTSAPAGDSYLKVTWVAENGVPAPIPEALFSFRSSQELAHSDRLRKGRELFLQHRCARCHQDAPGASPSPESEAMGPSLKRIGSRLRASWLADWIKDPKAQRSTALMPIVFHGSKSADEASSVAAFLASLREDPVEQQKLETSDEQRDRGKKLFESFHCDACHLVSEPAKADRIHMSLSHVGDKFQPGQLVRYLQNPEAHYSWTRMPNFNLSAEEAGQLAAFLIPPKSPGQSRLASSDPTRIEQGKQLVQSSGCLSCHELKLENRFKSRSLDRFTTESWKRGCMAEGPATVSGVPFFDFSTEQKESLRSFGTVARNFLRRDVPVEFLQRHTKALLCQECHGKLDGFPALERINGKLRPEWCEAFIAGRLAYRPRPWLAARMPAFPAYATGLARGLAMQNGFPPATPPDPSPDLEMAQAGHRLVGSDGGLSCIACHAVGSVAATQVFENAGINLAYSSSRLQKSYFERWLRNPLSIDPVSKMPSFFDEELRSPLGTFYDGDGRKQIEAIWQYLLLRDKMPPPSTGL